LDPQKIKRLKGKLAGDSKKKVNDIENIKRKFRKSKKKKRKRNKIAPGGESGGYGMNLK